MRKKIYSTLLAALMVSCLSCASVSAADLSVFEPDALMMPRYVYVDRILPSISISGSKVTASGYIDGYSTVTKIVYDVTLQVKDGKSWRYVNSWSGSSSSTRANYSYTHSGAISGDTYRTQTVVTIYSGSSKETVTAYSAEKKA